MNRIGQMTMPAGFRYKDVFFKGQPQHEPFDSFRVAHPSMDIGKRAKIFAPFDALKGFGDAVTSEAERNERLYASSCISSSQEYNEVVEEGRIENADEMV